MIEALPFLRPLWLLTIPLGLAVLAWLGFGRGQLASAWRDWVDPVLQPYVLSVASGGRAARWPWWVAALAVVLSGLTLAGPAGPPERVPLAHNGDAMVIVMDLSRSMDATDLAPSRLARARLKLTDILRERDGGETGLVVFSANAFVVVPLTNDVATIENQVPALTTSLMPSRGSYPESGIAKARQLMEQAGVSNGRVLLLTDGGDVDGAVESARALAEAGHELSVLAIGTPEGGPIPRERGGFLTNGAGKIALPKLEAAPLRRLARAGGGKFAVLANDDDDLARLDLASQARGVARSESTEQTVERRADLGPFLLLPLLLLIATAFRRGGYALAVGLAFVVPPRAEAFGWQDLGQTRDQQGQAALDAGAPDEAVQLFRDPARKGTAAFRAGDFAAAAEVFAGQDGADALYNAGTALARAGEIQSAIGALEAALGEDPAHADAAYNLEILRALQSQQQSQPGEGGGGEPQESDAESSSEGEQQSADNRGGPDDSQSESSEGGERGEDAGPSAQDDAQASAEEWRAAMEQAVAAANAEDRQDNGDAGSAASLAEREAQMALEQWLRRVPDDPGELLRRKFRRQYQRRQVDQDGNRLWPDDRREPW
ncbi:MAG: VWA domain-containing protein [Pseudomonadota bacterium]